ncbi:Adenylosuccinate lyase [Olea europaea subsp. europaea]|uniref:Adenylosuccinate lyase n=1 Tax=Olea europaea subsp. europaea TaxID=158383 RepID=A0A8S0P6Y3_OLEEU|nr:Adenylosuccinate lyase [Olea europaea subsp. europaea]
MGGKKLWLDVIEESFLQELIDGFSLDDALEVKNIEKVTNHDVKAVKYFLKQRCHSHLEIAKAQEIDLSVIEHFFSGVQSKVLEFFHFACTSEDINNLAHALMLKEVSDKVMLPVMDKLITAISNMATANARIPMLS